MLGMEVARRTDVVEIITHATLEPATSLVGDPTEAELTGIR